VADSDCPGGQTCGELGRCTAGEACLCTAGEFLGCAGDVARTCNAAANGVDSETCAAGCNADAQRCNSCVPMTASCNNDGMALERCGTDGLVAETETCRLECVAEARTVAAHCAYLQPIYLPDICDEPAVTEELVGSGNMDTSADVTCNGGIVTQNGGPEICVLRYRKITIDGSLTVIGGRAIAFVADDFVQIGGTLDVSANGSVRGPGGGALASGERAGLNRGGGGAGFRTAGAAGGAMGTGVGGAGGPAVDPLSEGRLFGGPQPSGPTFQQVNYPFPGGGGGGLTLIACRGEVTVAGTIDAGGGGGGGARDTNPVAGALDITGGAGGGAGGYVALQGIHIRVTGPSGYGVFANGGGGGGGCSTDGCIGNRGEDGHGSAIVASGGSGMNQGSSGGAGGGFPSPTGGLGPSVSPGGGGGASGRLQTFTPAVGTVTITATTSPGFEPNRMIQTR
jgi:hypothetical protein